MLRKALAVLIACSVLPTVNAAPGVPQAGVGANEVRNRIRMLPENSQVEVELMRGEKLKGRLGSVGQEDFELRISRNGSDRPRVLAFANVQSVHARHGMSTGAKIGLGVGIFSGMAVLVAVLVMKAIARNG